MTTRGLVALGDSITNGHGEPALGVHPQSWAQWVAEVLELPFTKLAIDGAQAADVLREQVPRLRGPYDVACVFAGVNDVRALGFDAAAYERDLRAIATPSHAASERLVLCTIPEDLGRPRAAPKPARGERGHPRASQRRPGTDVVALDDLAGAPWLLPDAGAPDGGRASSRSPTAPRAALGAPRLPVADRRGPRLAPRARRASRPARRSYSPGTSAAGRWSGCDLQSL